MFELPKIPIRVKLVALTFLTIIIGMVAAYYVNDLIIRTSLNRLLQEELVLLNHGLKREIEGSVEFRTEQIKTYSNDLSNESILIQSNEQFDNLENRQEYIDAQNELWEETNGTSNLAEELLNNELSTEIHNEFFQQEFFENKYGHKIFSETFVTNKYGANVALTNPIKDYNQADEEWWQQAKENGFYIGPVRYDESANENTVDLASAIYNSNGEFMGVFIGVLNLKYIENGVDAYLLEQIDIQRQAKIERDLRDSLPEFINKRINISSENFEVYLTNTDYELIYTSNKSFQKKRFEDISDFLPSFPNENGNLEISGIVSPNKNFDKDSFAYSSVELNGQKGISGHLTWYLWMQNTSDSVALVLNLLRIGVVIIVVAIGGAIIIFGSIISSKLMAPLENLIKTLNSMIENENIQQITTKRRDEFGNLVTLFNNFTNQIVKQRTLIDKEQEKLKQTISELKQKRERIEYMENVRILLEKLTETTDLETIMSALTLTLEDLLPFDTFSYILSSTKEDMNPEKLLYLHAHQNINKDYIKKINTELSRYLKTDKEKFINRKQFLNKINDGLIPNFIKGSLDEEGVQDFTDSIVLAIPFYKEDGVKSLGMLHVARKEGKYSSAQKRMVKNIVSIIAINLERVLRLIKEEKSRIENLIESISSGIIMFDPNKDVVIVNKNAAKILQIEEEKIDFSFVDKCCNKSDVLSIKDNPPLGEMLDKVMETNKPIKIPEVKPFENKYLEVFIVPVGNNQQGSFGTAIVMNDITQLKKVDEMKTEFVSMASHQLRTPLSAMRWFSEILLSGDLGKLNERQKEQVQDIYESNQRLIDLVNGLLNVTRIESGRLEIKPKPTDLNKLINEIVEEFQPQIENKGHTLKVEVDKNIPEINLDQKLMRNVYMNLLDNAIKYTPKEGNIKITVDKKGDKFISKVTDNGYGVPKEHQPQIFDKFFRAPNTAKKDTEGTGLGLYLAKKIVETAGGKIEIESEVDKGTTFTFSLPIEGMKPKKGEIRIDS